MNLKLKLGTNDIFEGVPVTTIRNNLEIMIDEWISKGLPASHLIITTLPPRRPGESSRIPALNSQIRTLAQSKGIKLVDIAFLTSNDDGLTWKSPTLHPTNDEIHYAESVRDSIADLVVSIMLQATP